MLWQDKSDGSDSCEEDDNSDGSYEDNEDEDELSLANSGSDLDSCQSENEFREAVDIEATKEELIETFKQKLNILQSEKKWFQSGCDLRTEIEDEIEGLREVYKGNSSTGEYLPNARLNEFRLELGKCLSGMKLVRK